MAQYIEVPAKVFLEEFARMLDLGPRTITGRHSSTGLHVVGVQVNLGPADRVPYLYYEVAKTIVAEPEQTASLMTIHALAAERQIEIRDVNYPQVQHLRHAKGNTAVWIAIAARHHKIFNILYHFARVSSPHHATGDLLCLAARRGDLDTLRELLKHGLAVDSEDRDGATALRVALAEGHADVARFLVLNGASDDKANHNEQTAAVSVEELRELMKKLDLAHPVTIVDTPSHAAAAVIREVGSPGDSRNGRRQSTRSDDAHLATEEKLKVEARKTLIVNDEGAENNSIDVIRDNDKLFIVTEEHMREVTSMEWIIAYLTLLNKVLFGLERFEGNDFASQNYKKSRYTHSIAHQCGSTNSVRKNAKGNTAVWIAIAARHHKIFNILYHFARVSSPHHATGDLLCLAARRGDLDTLRELLKHGLAVDSEDRDGATALRVALAEGHADVARFLVLNGASDDKANHNEQTAAVSVEELRELMKKLDLAHPVTIVDTPSHAAAAVIREVGSPGDSRNGRRQSTRSDDAHLATEEKLKVEARKTLIVNDEGAENNSIDVIRDNDKLFIVTEEHMREVTSMEWIIAYLTLLNKVLFGLERFEGNDFASQ
uniref:Uncharacterized protein n=1 Tax=Oryza punctata TaxID=4537 RepID=A0A0E0L2V6_ORYPU